MCAIAGFRGLFDPGLLSAMADMQSHRGPDDSGTYFDAEAKIGLAHRRLSILDLSPAGHQPMADVSGEFVISYNGEIYNFRELRQELAEKGITFRSHSDTEVILELYKALGTKAFSRLNGIFALAIWDAINNELVIARDGMGVKPLYYAILPEGMLFASELKALLTHSGLPREIDHVAAAAYLSYLWSPGERTMLRTVRKLRPGTCMRIGPNGSHRTEVFYELPQPCADRTLSASQAISGTREALRQATERQLISDVEVGAFLSGGLDSGAIVAFAREAMESRKMNCFTIGYQASTEEEDEMTSDLPYARRLAKYLGVTLHEVTADASMADRLDEMVRHLDEPQADPAALNTMMISSLAHQNGLKVLLSGTGGDDLFSGYRRHLATRMEPLFRMTPKPLLTAAQHLIAPLPQERAIGRRLRKLMVAATTSPDDRLLRYYEWLNADEAVQLLANLKAESASEIRSPMYDCVSHLPKSATPLDKLLWLDQHFFLADHNLNYTDKMGMAESVEIRVPFLDHDLVSWASRIPNKFKMNGSQTKWVLRKAMEGILPHNVIYRPKTGFGVPLRSWLKSDLRSLLEGVTASATIESRGLFEPQAVEALKRDTLAGRRDGSYTLLGIICMELWCREFLDKSAHTKTTLLGSTL